jgi:hypothetical protein
MKLQLSAIVMSLCVYGVSAGLFACDTSDPTQAVVDNAYPAPPDGGDPATQTVVYNAWWSVTLFSTPVGAGAESDQARAVTSTDFAYAVLAPGWDPSSTTAPTTLIPVKTAALLHADRGDTLHIVVSDATVVGNCAAGKPLSQADADFITQSIFPGLFSGVTYDAAKCVATPTPVDAGNDATPEAGSADAGTD